MNNIDEILLLGDVEFLLSEIDRLATETASNQVRSDLAAMADVARLQGEVEKAERERDEARRERDEARELVNVGAERMYAQVMRADAAEKRAATAEMERDEARAERDDARRDIASNQACIARDLGVAVEAFKKWWHGNDYGENFAAVDGVAMAFKRARDGKQIEQDRDHWRTLAESRPASTRVRDLARLGYRALTAWAADEDHEIHPDAFGAYEAFRDLCGMNVCDHARANAFGECDTCAEDALRAHAAKTPAPITPRISPKNEQES